MFTHHAFHHLKHMVTRAMTGVEGRIGMIGFKSLSQGLYFFLWFHTSK